MPVHITDSGNNLAEMAQDRRTMPLSICGSSSRNRDAGPECTHLENANASAASTMETLTVDSGYCMSGRSLVQLPASQPPLSIATHRPRVFGHEKKTTPKNRCCSVHDIIGIEGRGGFLITAFLDYTIVSKIW